MKITIFRPFSWDTQYTHSSSKRTGEACVVVIVVFVVVISREKKTNKFRWASLEKKVLEKKNNRIKKENHIAKKKKIKWEKERKSHKFPGRWLVVDISFNANMIASGTSGKNGGRTPR